VASSIAIRDGFLPPTINFEQPDPECAFDCIPNVARLVAPKVVQNNGFAFGGNNAVIILSAA
jgi:3-oxoacyl-[acyl-carrier-protein] synthase II